MHYLLLFITIRSTFHLSRFNIETLINIHHNFNLVMNLQMSNYHPRDIKKSKINFWNLLLFILLSKKCFA